MSINITVHGSPVKHTKKCNILFDPERRQKELLNERRKQRIEQVRQKSKEFASKVRRNVNLEQEKQLKRIEETKANEMAKWRQNIKNKYQDTLPEIGEAHRAAINENIEKQRMDQERQTNRDSVGKILNFNNNQRRVNFPMEKINPVEKPSQNYRQKVGNKENIAQKLKKKSSFPSHLYPEISILKPAGTIITSDENLNDKILQQSNKYSNTQENASQFISKNKLASRNLLQKNNVNDLDISSSSSILDKSEPKESTYAAFKKRQQLGNKLHKTPSVTMEVGSSDEVLNSSSSSLEIQDSHYNTNRHFSRVYSKTKSGGKSSNNYDPKNFEPQETSEADSEKNVQKTSRAKFTQITDFLKKIRHEPQSIQSSVKTTTKKSNEISKKIIVDETPKRPLFGSCGRPLSPCKSPTKTVNLSPRKTSLAKKNQATSPIVITSPTKVSSQQLKKALSKAKNTNVKFLDKSKVTDKESDSLQSKVTLSSQNTIKSKSKPLPTILPSGNIKAYDYNNRFEKQIDPSLSSNIIIERRPEGLNAMENAVIERQLEQSREHEIELLKKKSEERCQKALEREQVRRDYEALQAKLDALTKDKQKTSSIYYGDDNAISDTHLKRVESARIDKINTAVENVIRRPVVITCPEVTNPPLSTFSKPYSSANIPPTYSGINLADNEHDSGTLNSSDSCCSILLNYVENQSKQIHKDIENCDSTQKSRKLKELLNKLELLKCELLKEIKKTEIAEDKQIKNMVDSISELRKERENIMLISSEKKDLEKREKKLKHKEAILEKKLKEFYDMKRAEIANKLPKDKIESSENKIQNKNKNLQISDSSEDGISENQDESSECIDKNVIIANKPIEIVIKVKDPKTKVKTPSKSPRKRATLIIPQRKPIKKFNIQKISTPLKEFEGKKDQIWSVNRFVNQTNSEFTTSTVYKSPPDTIRTQIGEFIDRQTDRGEENLDMPKKSKPDKVGPNIEARSKPRQIITKTTHELPTGQSKVSLNPLLGHYIQRLLGMSRHSINMLGVSSSDIPTPSSSLVNTTDNISELDSNQRERIDRIQRFVEDNYSFISEIEDSLKQQDKSGGSSEQSIKIIEEIWKKSLKQKQLEEKKKEKETIKPILKKPTPRKKKVKKMETSNEVLVSNSSKDNSKDKLEVLEKYTEMTDNCTQRIAELNEMINRVRKEKQKILEITLSSNGANSETEYLDFASRKQQHISPIENHAGVKNAIKSPKSKILENIPPIAAIPTTPIKEGEEIERGQLEKNKLTGVSRDSGISLSRPVTALDHRYSPDNRDKNDEIFEPLLKDIPKPSNFNIPKNTIVNAITITKQTITSLPAGNDKFFIKKAKPPASISRYSPQLVEDLPHELSTILEIDTPATSRINITTKEKLLENVQETVIPQEIDIKFKKFQTFEEYAKEHNLDIRNFDPEVSAQINKEFLELFQLTQSFKDASHFIKDFPSISSFEKSNLHDNNNEGKSENESLVSFTKHLSLKKFPTPKEYFTKIGATDLLDSQSIENISDSKSTTYPDVNIKGGGGNKTDSFSKQIKINEFPTSKEFFRKNDINTDILDIQSIEPKSLDHQLKDLEKSLHTSEESLPDVNAELKRRNIMTKSFKTQIFRKSNDDDDGTSADILTSDSSKENKQPKENIKTLTANDLSGIEMLSTSSSSKSQHRQIEKDLNYMGMKWASMMLKKSQQSQALSSSTSSGFVYQKQPKLKSPKKAGDVSLKTSTKLDPKQEDLNNTTNTTVDNKFSKPINLREFLAQELQKRTNSTESTSITDDTLASLFLKSLLGSETTPTSKNLNGGATSADRQQKTSTPVLINPNQSSSSIKQSSSLDSNSLKLFSGESRISSVRCSSNSNTLSSSEGAVGRGNLNSPKKVKDDIYQKMSR